MSLKRRLKAFWWGIRNFPRNVAHVIRWLPILWRDRDWDWTYLMRIYEFKLRNMSKCFKKYGHHVNSDRDAKQVLIAAELCKRLYKDEYADWMWDEIHQLEGEFVFEPTGHGTSRLTHPYSKISKEEAFRRGNIAMKHEQMMRKQDIDLLFKLHRKYLHCWWD
jgi:hypothetical protein